MHAGTVNPRLEVSLYQGRWQLATGDALYSDGDRYRPLLLAFRQLRQKLGAAPDMLLLGTGLGSAVHILHRMGRAPRATLVELDEVVLALAMALMPPDMAGKLRPVAADAAAYMERQQDSYDLVVVDIFIGKNVPAFVTTAAFLQQCRAGVRPGGCFVFNYIPESVPMWEKTRTLVAEIFPQHSLIEFGVNKVFIGYKE
jgi:spermidine synthase